MKIILTSKNQAILVDDELYDDLSQYNWYIDCDGYARRGVYDSGKMKAEIMHRRIMNAPKGMQVDHVNGIKVDNRVCNLRVVTGKQNRAGYCKSFGTSGVRGVHKPSPKGGGWRVCYNGKYIGSASTIEDGEAMWMEKCKLHDPRMAEALLLLKFGLEKELFVK